MTSFIVNKEVIKMKLLLILVYIVPFIAIINYRLNLLVSYLVIGIPLLLIVIINFKRILVLRKGTIELFLIFCSLLVCALFGALYKYIKYSDFDFYFIQFFFTFILYGFVILLYVDIKVFLKRYFYKYIKYLFYLISIASIVDFLLFFVFNRPELQLMYDPLDYAYNTKGLGLFGQPSVSASLISFFYLLKSRFDNKRSLFEFIFYLIAVISCLTGTGYLCIIIVIVARYWKQRLVIFTLFPLVIFISIYVFFSNIIYKVSLDYTLELVDIFKGFFEGYYIQVNSFYDILFGVDPSYIVPIDFGPLFYIGNVGVIAFVIYTCLLLYSMVKSRSYLYRFSVVILLVANLHYPVMFFPLMHFVLFFVLFFEFNE